MRNRRRRLKFIAAALLAAALAVAATAAAAQAPIRPVKVANAAEIEKVVPYGRSRVLLLNKGFRERGGITRVNLDGSVDRSFGDRGTVHIATKGVAVTRDGDILVAAPSVSKGIGKAEGQVIRLLPDGKLDHSFGSGGHADVNFGPAGQVEAVAVAGDVLLAGVRERSPEGDLNDLAVARLRPDGSPDPSFGKHGVTIFRTGDEIFAFDIAATPSGGVVVEEGNNIEAYLVKLDRDGVLDPRFGPGSAIRREGGEQQYLSTSPGFVQLPGGKLLVAYGTSRHVGPSSVAVVRYRADGRVDRSYGDHGWALAPARVETSPAGLTLLPGGALAVGTTFGESGESRDFGTLAFTRSGQVDRSYAAQGSCVARLPEGQEVVDVAAVAGRPVVLGHHHAGLRLLLCPPSR
jgi:uncharacterized delta-60 repeat protein